MSYVWPFDLSNEMKFTHTSFFVDIGVSCLHVWKSHNKFKIWLSSHIVYWTGSFCIYTRRYYAGAIFPLRHVKGFSETFKEKKTPFLSWSQQTWIRTGFWFASWCCMLHNNDVGLLADIQGEENTISFMVSKISQMPDVELDKLFMFLIYKNP